MRLAVRTWTAAFLRTAIDASPGGMQAAAQANLKHLQALAKAARKKATKLEEASKRASIGE